MDMEYIGDQSILRVTQSFAIPVVNNWISELIESLVVMLFLVTT